MNKKNRRRVFLPISVKVDDPLHLVDETANIKQIYMLYRRGKTRFVGWKKENWPVEVLYE